MAAMTRLPAPVPLAFDPSRPAARYRFVLEGGRGRIKHSGLLRLAHRYEGEEPVAIGEIGIDADGLAASFAHVTEGWREAAERELTRWAELDGWPAIEILPGTQPLAVQTFRERVSAIAGPGYAQSAFHFRAGRPPRSTGMTNRGEAVRQRRRRFGRGNA
jgi:hypothetical protein